MAINHTITYSAYAYDENGHQISVRETITVTSKYEHQTRRGLVQFADNAAFWDAYRKNAVYRRIIAVDGNAA